MVNGPWCILQEECAARTETRVSSPIFFTKAKPFGNAQQMQIGRRTHTTSNILINKIMPAWYLVSLAK